MENYLEFLSPNLNHALAWMVIHSLWQATLIALIVGIFMIINNKKSPQFRYALGNVGLLLIIISSITTFLYYYYQSVGNPNVSYIPNTFDVQTKAQLTITPEQASLSISNVDESNLFNKTALINYFNQNIYTIVLIWLFGMVLFLMRLLGGISYVYYLKHRLNFPVDEYWSQLLNSIKTKLNFSKNIEFVESALVRSPMVIGHLKPIILFPIGSINKLEVNEVEAILAHEIAHILRNDYLINILQTILEAIFYFHPAVWWLSSQVRIERENCCDDVAVKICGNSLTYAKSLVRVQEMTYIQNPQIAMSAGGQKRSLLFQRVQRILNHKQHKTTISDKLISFGVILSIILCVSFVDSKLNNNKTYGAIKKLESTIALDSTSTYIKYYNNAGELDSFIITGKIKDGIYDFTDRLYTAILEVKNNFVISFNINGLQVDKKDFQKFSGIINQIILTNNEQNNSEVNATSSEHSKTLSYSYNPYSNEIQSSIEHNSQKRSEKNASWFLEHANEYPGNYIKEITVHYFNYLPMTVHFMNLMNKELLYKKFIPIKK
ncbi:MAG: M56 family metallopeptidase [Saprospiraceae bacterium]|nr:M56 family metallopeptidase [Candidatus Defluviibacterium haderslevense]